MHGPREGAVDVQGLWNGPARHIDARRRGRDDEWCRRERRPFAERRHRVARHTPQRFVERTGRFVVPALAQVHRPDRVPRVAGALACVEMPGGFDGQLETKFLEGPFIIPTREMKEAKQPMQGQSAEPRASL